MISIDDLYKIFLQHPIVTTDSREIPSGSIFFALKGDRFDGNAFAEQALSLGARYAVIDDPKYYRSESFILVDDVLKSIQALALHHRNQLEIPVIAITGTNGKTTTKELVSKVLSQRYRVISTLGNLNNHIGVPLTLLRINSESEIAVIEMGANHVGEIDFLARIALPTHGLITNVGKAHLEGFGSFEGVIKTKTELFRFLKERGGFVFVNNSNPILMQHLHDQPTITYSLNAPADLVGKIVPGSVQVELELSFDKITLPVHSQLFGQYNAENILAAATIGKFFNVTTEKIITAIEDYKPTNNRSQIKQTERNLLILDAYNANPSSMKEAITHFASLEYKNKVLILGDMLELGDESETEHLKVMELVKSLEFQEVYLVGPVMTRLCTEIDWHSFHDSELAKMWFEHHAISGKTILVKGSRGIKMELISEML